MFLSTVTNALDAKGRISVPADFRAVVGVGGIAGAFDGIIVWPSFNGEYLEGGGLALLHDYQMALDTLDPYDDARIALQRAIFSESRRLSFDSNGRVSLPKELAEYAGLNGSATFTGLGRRFEIWNPDAYNAQTKSVREMARENRHRLRPVSQLTGVNLSSPNPSGGA